MVLLALVVGSQASGKSGDLYALRYGAQMNHLVAYDPVRIVPAGRSIRVGQFAHAWSVSPDRLRFVAASSRGSATVDGTTALQLVDLASGRIEGIVSLPGERRRVTATAWVRGRVLAIVSGSTSTTVYSVDPNARAVISQIEFPGTVSVGERTPSSVVLLLTSPGTIGPATLAVVDQRPRVRTVTLDRIHAGMTVTGTGSERRTTVRRPGLALWPSDLRAFVFGADEPAAAIDLRTLAVTYPPVRMLAAAQKGAAGAVRTAAALPDGRIVVAGYRLASRGSATLQLVEPKSWTTRTLTPTSPWFTVGGGMVFTHGANGSGLRILRPSGEAVELLRGRSVANVVVVGPRALVTFFGTDQNAAVIVLGTGRILRHTVPAHPLLGAGQAIFVG
jgi:hypothetical protein